MRKDLRVEQYGRIEISFATDQVGGPWVSLAGDCFFRHIHQDFSVGPLKIEDCPFNLSFPRSKIDELMNAVNQHLPASTGLLILHVGANNIASTRYPARAAASNLLERCVELMHLRPHIGEISICLLSPRTVDDHGVYSVEYIAHYNQKVAEFNDEILTRLLDMPRFSYIDFKLEQKNLWFLLRETGFGVNDGGRHAMARTLQAIIIWKRLCGEAIRRGEPSTSYVPDRLFNIPFADDAQFVPLEPSRCAPSVPPLKRTRRPLINSAPDFAPEPWLQPPPMPQPPSQRPEPWLRAPTNYSNSRLQGEFRSYIQDFSWEDERRPPLNSPPVSQAQCAFINPQPFSAPADVIWSAPCQRPPFRNHATNPPAPFWPPRATSNRLRRCTAATLPVQKRNGERSLKTIRKARRRRIIVARPSQQGFSSASEEVWIVD